MAKYQTNYLNTDLLTNATKAQRAKAQADAAKALSKSGNTSKPTTKKMSAGMAAWVKANRSKLKNATAKQKAIFKQYDALKKEGRLPDTSSTKSRPSPQAQPSTSTKSAGTKPVQVKSKVQKAVAATKPKPEKPVVRGKFLDSNPPLKSQPKKPKRSSFSTGRTGARSYAAALAKYRKLLARIPKIKRKKPQRRGTAFR